MRLVVDVKHYYQWERVWSSESREKTEELELAFYKVGIASQLKKAGESFELWSPYTKAELARSLAEAFEIKQFEYPDAIVVNRQLKSYNRFVPVKGRHRGSWAVLMIGGAFLMLALVKVIYQFLM